MAGEFVSEQYSKGSMRIERGAPTRAQPWATTAGAEVDNPLGIAVPDRAKKVRLHRAIDIAAADDGFEKIGGAVPYRLRAPRLIENFK